MAKKGNRIFSAVVAVVAILQSICLPASRERFYFQSVSREDSLRTADDGIVRDSLADQRILDSLADEHIKDSLLLDEFDVTDYDTNFTGWKREILFRLADTLLPTHEEDTSAIEWEYYPDGIADSLQIRVDSLVNVLRLKDSVARAKVRFQAYFDSLPRKEQKKWIMENVTIPKQRHMADSILAVKDSIQAIKDSIIQFTPRILESPFIPDSLHYKRLLYMTQDKKFGDLEFHVQDTSYNYHFYDYPFMREDVGATWLGVAGSALQYYNYTKREEEDNAIMFTPYRSWTNTPSNLAVYNTKTPYTELAYWGTLFAGDDKEEINVKLLTTQNITPGLNISLDFNKFGGVGTMQKETTQGHHLALSGHYVGKKYTMHTGWIHNKIIRLENGGFQDNMWIRDTVVDSKEIEVNIAGENDINKNTLFLNQTLRIPFGTDSLTTAFIGHSSEFDIYKKTYTDAISSEVGRNFYNNQFNINSSSSADTMKVMRFDNKFYLRLQPWKDDAIISKIDAGVGDKLLKYYDYLKDEESGTFSSGSSLQNNIYAYAGAKGMVHQYFKWNANGQLYFAGPMAGDFNIDANVNLNFFPFRKARKSPLSFTGSFHTDLTEPDHYHQQICLNHYKWNNSFSKQSTSRIGGSLDIPYWKLHADAYYTLKTNTIYFDSLGVVAQHAPAVGILSANLRKEFVFGPVHLDNRILFQTSTDQTVAPVPMLAVNLRYFIQFDVVKRVMQMQIGANGLYTTKWYMSGYNPNVGVFYNQRDEKYGGCPYIDAFVNIQWKEVCLFLKVENVNQGWPLEDGKDYFTAHHYIHTQRTFKMGIFWPFYIKPAKEHKHVHGPGEEE